MKPLYVLIGSFVLAALVLKFAKSHVDYPLAGRIAMAVMLIFTAIGHFAFTKGMEGMVPEFLPLKSQIIIVTGILEIVFAVGLILPKYSNLTGWILIGFFVLLLPANIKASMENLNYQTGEHNGPGMSYLWIRIPLQLLFIVWTYFSAIKR